MRRTRPAGGWGVLPSWEFLLHAPTKYGNVTAVIRFDNFGEWIQIHFNQAISSGTPEWFWRCFRGQAAWV